MPFARRLARSGLYRIRKFLERPRGYREAAVLGRHVGIGSDCVVIRSTIGDYSYVGDRCVIAHASIGRFCSVASEVHIGSGSHPTRDAVSTHPIFYLAQPGRGWDLVGTDRRQEFVPTIVGNDVWIGAKALIRDGVAIGDGAIIGAGAIVVRDVEPYAIYGGVPARLIRFRFPPDTIAQLLARRWWDRDVEWLRANIDAFADIADFEQLLDE